MKVYPTVVIKEVDQILKNSSGNLVLISRPSDHAVLTYDIVNKVSHSVCLIDDKEVAELIIQKLLYQRVDIFDNDRHFNRGCPRNPPRPLFWPNDKPWPSK